MDGLRKLLKPQQRNITIAIINPGHIKLTYDYQYSFLDRSPSASARQNHKGGLGLRGHGVGGIGPQSRVQELHPRLKQTGNRRKSALHETGWVTLTVILGVFEI